MNSDAKQTDGGYVHIPDGSQILIVRDEPEKSATQTDTKENKFDFRIYWHTINKHKWIILGLTILIGLLTALKTASLPHIYRSTALLLIEFNQAKIISIEEVYGLGSHTQAYYQTQLKILKSRVLAEKLVDKLNLLNSHQAKPVAQQQGSSWLPGVWSPPEKAPSSPTAEDRRNAIVEAVMEGLSVKAVRNSQLVAISFESTDPKFAAQVPNVLADIYIENDLDAKLAMTNKAAEWLTKRVEGLRKKLSKSEKTLQQYIESHGLINVAGVKTLATKQIEETAATLVEAHLQLAKVENVYKQVQGLRRAKSSSAYESIPAIVNHPLIQNLKQVELEAARKISELRERYGKKHQKMVAAQAELNATRKHIATQIQRAIDRITKKYELAQANVKTLEDILETNKNKIQAINRKEYELSVLERDVEINRQLYDLFLTRFKETDASQDVQALQSTVGRVVEPAIVATMPYKPQKKRIVVISLILGLSFSTLLAFFLEYLDNTLKNSEDVEQKLGLPLLSALPKLKIPKTDKMKAMWMFLKEQKSQFSESVRTARTGIMLSNLDTQHKVLIVTSSVPNEGKTTFAINQAFALGQMDKTLLIDADMRRPSIAKSLGLSDKAPGLSDLVAGTHHLDECIDQIGEDGGNVDIIPSGVVPPNPLDLLSSERFGEILEELSQKYGYIVIDSAPTMAVSDALVLAKHASGVLYVVKANATPYQVVREGLKRLRQVKAPVYHIVLNQLDINKPSKYYGYYGKNYYYRGYYGDEKQSSTT
ncbi:MAG: polysaccharide biosynthesis tyrosine autokinase [Pseudomonadota bacterium]